MDGQSRGLNGRVALVTGGGRGIGRAIAKGLAEAGAAVAVVARSEDELRQTVADIDSVGGRAIAIPVDVTDAQSVSKAVGQTESRFGPVDVLVNNAAVVGQPGPVGQTDTDEWWSVMDVNLRGPLLCARAVLPGMTRRKRGVIVNVSSGAGNFAWRNVSAYAVSKCALTRFSEILALETAPDNITVFALSPGVVRTSMTAKASSAEWRKWDTMVADVLEEGGDVPPDEAVRLTLVLVSGRADALSGRYIRVTDDLDGMIARAKRIEEEGLYTLRLQTL